MTKVASALKDAAFLWYDKDADYMAATVAYYALFAIAPLILLTVTLLSLVFERDLIRDELLRWGAVLGPDVNTLLSQAVLNLSELSVGIGVPIFGALFFSGMVVMMCNTITSGFHSLWGIPHKGIKGWFLKSRNSILFLLVLELYLLVMIGSSFMTDSLGIGRIVFYFGATTALFSIMYRVLPWSAPSLLARLCGAAIASLLFTLAKVAVASYVAMTPVPGLFGTAGLMLVLLIWLYVIAGIIYYGAAVAYTLDKTTK